MARIPGTVWVGEQSSGSLMTAHDIFCIHTIVGYAPAHAAHVSTKGSGLVFQSRDTKFRSEANLDGNHRIVASENEDHGVEFGGVPSLPGWVPLTREQVVANGRVLASLHEIHGIPLSLCPNSLRGSRGLAYHRQGIDGNFGSYRFPGRVPGGEIWTKHYGKVCPTDIRIAQLPDILSVARNGGRDNEVVTNKEMNEIAAKTAALLEPALVEAVRNNRLDVGGEHTRSDDAVAELLIEQNREMKDNLRVLMAHLDLEYKSRPKPADKPKKAESKPKKP